MRTSHRNKMLDCPLLGSSGSEFFEADGLKSEFLRLELLLKTAFDCADSSVQSERNAALACLNAAQHSAQVFREMLFKDA